jgi:hypothetical protein
MEPVTFNRPSTRVIPSFWLLVICCASLVTSYWITQYGLLKNDSFFPLYAAGEERVLKRSDERVSKRRQCIGASASTVMSLVYLLTPTSLRLPTLSFASKKEGLITFFSSAPAPFPPVYRG